MSVLLQVSDPHFGTERAAAVEALVRLAAEARPNLVVLSGDITQRARRAQFAAAVRLVERLAAPALAIPGNHDVPLFNLAARAFSPYGGYAAAFGEALEPTHESAELLVIGVNTTRARRHKHGEVSAAQVERVARRLRAALAQQLRVVVVHHPLHVPSAADEVDVVRGAEPAARAWAAAGADLVMGGHIHLPFVRELGERFSGLARPLWVVQAGTAVSHRVREGGGERNSVNLIRYAAGSLACTVERWDHDPSRQSFVRVAETRIALSR